MQGLEVEPKFRRETRAPLVAQVLLEYPDEESPESAFTANVSMGGFFVQSPEPRPIGTSFRFQLLILSKGPVVQGFGEVRWVRQTDQGPGQPAGMGVQAGMVVSEEGQKTLRQAVAGAIKAGSIADGAVLAPALQVSSAEAKEALVKASGQGVASPAAGPQAATETDDMVLQAPEVEPVFRRATRALLVAPVVVEDPDDDSIVTGYPANVSMEGLFFQTSRPRPVGSHVTFELKIQARGPTVRGIGSVRWVRAEDQGPGLPAGMGIQIIQLPGAETAKQLRQALAGAVKASTVSSAPVPAPALPMSSPEAMKALERARLPVSRGQSAPAESQPAEPEPAAVANEASPPPAGESAAATEPQEVFYREATRVPLVAPIELEYAADKSTESSYTLDVSIGGFFIMSPNPRPLGTKVGFELKIQSDTAPVKGFGEVRWIRVRDEGRRSPAGIGIEISLLVGEEGQRLLRSTIAAASKASEVSNSPVPAPALPLNSPKAREALARARPLKPVLGAGKPAAEDKILRRKRERFKFGEHSERSSELKLKRMTAKAIKEGRKPKKFTLEKDGDEDVSMLERFRVRYKITKPGFLIFKALVVIAVLLWLADVLLS
ncbi:MAG: PilZ domain-containing protein [Thermoanaerobaculia bacterium]